MKNYLRIAELTNEYLSGKLNKMQMEYNENGTLHVSISYEDFYSHTFDYDLNVNPINHEIQFLSHFSKNLFTKIKLDRDSNFENAVCTYLCKTL